VRFERGASCAPVELIPRCFWSGKGVVGFAVSGELRPCVEELRSNGELRRTVLYYNYLKKTKKKKNLTIHSMNKTPVRLFARWKVLLGRY